MGGCYRWKRPWRTRISSSSWICRCKRRKIWLRYSACCSGGISLLMIRIAMDATPLGSRFRGFDSAAWPLSRRLLQSDRGTTHSVPSQAHIVNVPPESFAVLIGSHSESERHRLAGVAAQVHDHLLERSQPSFHKPGLAGQWVFGEVA